MKLGKREKKFIKKNYRKIPIAEIARKLNLTESIVIDYLRSTGKEISVESEEPSSKPKSFSDIARVLTENKLFLVTLLILTFIVYFNSLFGGLISGDDVATMTSPYLANFSLALQSFSIYGILSSLLYQIFGPNPFIFHLRSLSLHLLAVILVFIVSSQLLDRRKAMIASLLFSVHPVTVEAVSWISGYSYICFGITILLSVIPFLLYQESRNRKYLYISAAIYTLSLFTIRNPWILATIPVILVLDFCLYPTGLRFKEVFKDSLFFLIPTLFSPIFLLNAAISRQEGLAALSRTTLSVTPTASYTIRIPFSLYSAARLLVFPYKLSLFNENNPISSNYYLFMIAVSVVSLALPIFLFSKNRLVAGFLLIIPLSFLPVFSPVILAFFMAERYLYMGVVFFCLALAFFLVKIEDKTKIKNLAYILTIIIVSLYSIRTVSRNGDWNNSRALWSATALVSPYSPRVYNNLGDAYSDEPDKQKAIAFFKKAIELDPNYADAIHNLGNAYLLIGDYGPARQNLEKSLELNPALYQSAFELGILEYQQGNIEKAKEYFEKTLEINPASEDAKKALEAIQHKSP